MKNNMFSKKNDPIQFEVTLSKNVGKSYIPKQYKKDVLLSNSILLCFFITVNLMFFMFPLLYSYLGFLLSLIILASFYIYDR